MFNGFCAVDAAFRVIAVNLQASSLLGAGRRELLGAETRDLTIADACETILRETLAAAHEDDARLLITEFVPRTSANGSRAGF
jgi:PAS domain-containing protein